MPFLIFLLSPFLILFQVSVLVASLTLVQGGTWKMSTFALMTFPHILALCFDVPRLLPSMG